MGWTSIHTNDYKNGKIDRKSILDDMNNRETEKETNKLLKSVMKGSTYYAAIETVNKITGKRCVWALVTLTSVDNRDYYNFSYKDMDETMGPYKYDCPGSILSLLTPTDSVAALQWRRLCVKNGASWLKKVPIGGKVLWKGKTLVKHAPAYQFKQWFWYCPESNTYIPKTRLNDTNCQLVTE